MRDLSLTGLRLVCVFAGAATLSAVLPQKGGIASAAAEPIVQGPGSLSGVWVKTTERYGDVNGDQMYQPREQVMKTADGSPTPLQPGAAAIAEKRLKDAEAGHPFADTKSRCLPGGVPDMMFGSGPMQILETPGQVTILRQEFTFFRIIHLGATHPADPDPTYLGNSVGRWNGDTLVVDTIGVTDKTTIKGVIPHTDALHVVERFHRVGKDILEINAVIDDSKAFTKPWTMTTRLKLQNEGLSEYFCDNNRNLPDANGNLTAVMPRS